MAVRGTSWSNLKLVSSLSQNGYYFVQMWSFGGHRPRAVLFFQMQDMGEFKDIGQ